jgi:hypothetical protein
MACIIITNNSSRRLLLSRLFRSREASATFSSITDYDDNDVLSNSSLTASVRISSDLEIGSCFLRHSSALRILDNHLHTTNLLPRPDVSNSSSSSSSKRKDIFCIGQAVTCYRQPSLLDELHKFSNQDDQSNNGARTHVWVADAGSSAITFGGAITFAGMTLATSSRIFIRVDVSSAGGTPQPIKITDTERSTMYNTNHRKEENDNDLDGSIQFGHAIPKMNKISLLDDNGDDWNNNDNNKVIYRSPLIAGEEVLSVIVGPQHINHGNHVDHAFLADTAFHALFLGGRGSPDCGGDELLEMPIDQSTLRVQYMNPGKIGQELRCHVKDGKIASVWGRDIVRDTDDTENDDTLLVLAEESFV